MIKPVDTRWNTKSLMISRALDLKSVIDDICSKNSLTSQYGTRPLKLKREEWEILKELAPLLGVCTTIYISHYSLILNLQAFHDVSLEMQSSGIPLISSVIPRIDDLVQVIDNFKDDIEKHPAVRSAAIRGLAILNKYYQKSDESFVYRIAIGNLSFYQHVVPGASNINLLKALDPRYKLRYFTNQEWPDSWINAVKTITRLVYNEDYPRPTTADTPMSPKKLPAPSGDWPSLLRKKTVKAVTQERDELMAFWAAPCEPIVTDPFQYWEATLVHQPGNRLARMAIDYLSAPATAVDVERAFSRGALTVTHRRHTLSDTSTRNSIVLGAWLKDTNLVPKDELVEHFRRKPFRSHTLSTRDSVGENGSELCDFDGLSDSDSLSSSDSSDH
jgi:hypothetical protein